jgi:hypothetical protein
MWGFAMVCLTWPYKFVLGLIGFLGILQAIRDEFISEHYRQYFHVFHYLLPWPWYIWAIGFLLAIFFLFLRGNFERYIEMVQKIEDLEKRLIPCLEATNIEFEKTIRRANVGLQEVIYNLYLNFRNPINRGLSIYKAKALIISAESDWGDMRECKLRFEYDVPNYLYEIDFSPGDERRLRIATFIKVNSKPIELYLSYVNPGEQRMSLPNLAIKEQLSIQFRLICENQGGQEWGILFGIKNNELWAIATQDYPSKSDGSAICFETRMPLDPDTPHFLTL